MPIKFDGKVSNLYISSMGRFPVERARVLVLESNALLRRGLKSVIEADNELTVIADTGRRSMAWSILKDSTPDLLLMGFDSAQLPFVGKVRRAFPSVKIVLFTDLRQGSERSMIGALRLGVSGCVMRTCTPEEVVEALVRVKRGETVFSRALTDSLLQILLNHDHAKAQQPETKLTKREMEVVECLTEGMSNKEIASHLGVSVHTVKAYVSSIMRKLEVSARTQIIVKVLKEGILQSDQLGAQ